MKLQKFIQSEYGKLIISLILGFGLSTLFRKTCSGKDCLDFKGPSMDKIKGQMYKYDDKCYLFNPIPTVCSPTKKIVKFD